MLVSVAFCANTVVARKSPKSFILIFALLLTNQKNPRHQFIERARSAPLAVMSSTFQNISDEFRVVPLAK